MTRDIEKYTGQEIAVHESLSETGVVVASDVPDHLAAHWGSVAPARYAAMLKATTAVLGFTSEPQTLIASFDSLPETVQLAVYDQLAMGPPSRHHIKPASDADVAYFVDEQDFGSFCAEQWGARKTSWKLAAAEKRIGYILVNLDAQDQEVLLDWFDGLHREDAAAIYCALAE